MQIDLKLIKKYYGEDMMHLCRSLFPSILENDGLLFSILKEHFGYSKFLYNDINTNSSNVQRFKSYIYSLVNHDLKFVKSDSTPFELMDKAGYDLYECKSRADIEKFKKYYAPNEKLCTFTDENRLNTNYIFFAVKKDVDNINREDFIEPKREDLYGTSVISLQFSKIDKTLSIKNRYNHIVVNPDATFSNNLENIIFGLTYSFEKYLGFEIKSNKSFYSLDQYRFANDLKFYRINFEINNICYGPNNIIIDNGRLIVDYMDKSKYIIMNYFIIDLSKKQIFLYDDKIEDSFIDYYGKYEKLDIIKNVENRILNINYNNKLVSFTLNKYNELISIVDNNIMKINDYFLRYNKTVKQIEMLKIKKIGSYFLHDNDCLDKIDIPNIEIIGDRFLNNNSLLREFKADNLKVIGNHFIYYGCLNSINIPNIIKVGNYFLAFSYRVEEFDRSWRFFL